MQPSAVARIDVHILATRLREQPQLQLLDCREVKEWQTCRIEGARHIPMSEIRTRYTELDSDRPTVVYCHHGIRSLSVAGFLAAQGYPQVWSLNGGIDAWSREIDAGVPRY